MKARKIVSTFGTAAAALTTAAMMLVSYAGAWDYYYADKVDVAVGNPDREAIISEQAENHITSTSILSPMAGENTRLTKRMISALSDQFDKLSVTVSNFLDNDFKAIRFSLNHTVSCVPNVGYDVYITKEFLDANSGRDYVNIALNNTTYGSPGELKLTASDTGWRGTLYYRIGTQGVVDLLNAYEVEINDKLLVYSLDDNDEVVYSDVKPRPDASLTFAMSSGDYTRTGLYVTKYNSKSYEYFSRNELLPIIEAEMISSLGFTDSDLENKTVKQYIDAEAEKIRDLMFDESGNSRYASVENVEKAVHDFYLGTETVDGKTGFTYAAQRHQEELAEALMQTNAADSIIMDSIYSAFGIGISEREAAALKEALWEDLVEKTVKEMNDYENGSSSQVGNISYFLSRITSEEYKKLAAEIDEVKQKFKGTSAAEPTLAEILTSINDYKDRLRSGNQEITVTEILDYIKKTDAFLNGRKDQTIDDVLTEYGDALRTYADSTGRTAYNDSVTYTDQARSDAVTASQKYTDSQLLISNYELQRQLNSLKDQIEDIEDEIYDLRRERDYYYNSYYNTSDWIIRNYGSVDGFISAVANEAANRIAANGRTGESAYEIAVRNGFVGTEREWLNSLVGESAYDIAVQNGFRGTQADWLDSLRGEDGRDGVDGEDGRVIYVYGNQPQSAAPSLDDEDGEELDPDSVISGTVFGEDAELADPDDSGSAYGTVNKRTSAPAAAAGVVPTTGTVPTAGDTSAPPENKIANPKTGAAAGIIIPVAAVGSLLLIKKDKRKRGRR